MDDTLAVWLVSVTTAVVLRLHDRRSAWVIPIGVAIGWTAGTVLRCVIY